MKSFRELHEQKSADQEALDDLYGELTNLQHFVPNNRAEFEKNAKKNKATYIQIAKNIQKYARKI